MQPETKTKKPLRIQKNKTIIITDTSSEKHESQKIVDHHYQCAE